jgi:hypothetical protein
VVASANRPAAAAVVEPTSDATAAPEAQIETIVEEVAEVPVEAASPEEVPAPATAEDLESRYGFEPKEKSGDA